MYGLANTNINAITESPRSLSLWFVLLDHLVIGMDLGTLART